MRQARAVDWRRRLQTKQDAWEIQLKRISYENIPSLGSGEAPIASPLTFLSGPNGVGKTTLLRAVWGALAPSAAKGKLLESRAISGGSCEVELEVAGTSVTAEVEFAEDDISVQSQVDFSVMHVDGGSDSRQYQRFFCQFEGVEDIINGAAAKRFDERELADINYILNRSYRSVTLYEIEADGPAPFFEVAYGNDTYDSRTMGAGEIAAFHIWWQLKVAEASSILLVEEPEAFLSFSCQQALSDYLCYIVVKKRLCAVVSSHAAAFISGLPNTSTLFLSRGEGGLTILPDDPPPILLKSIGIDPPLVAVIFVEDKASKNFCKAMLEKLDPGLARRVAIEVRSGEAEITRALTLTSEFRIGMKFIGLYDGDQRDRIPLNVAELSTFLPGDHPIEHVFRDMVSANPNLLEEATGAKDLTLILNGLEGKDVHDWYEGISKEVGLTAEQMFPTLFRIWIKEEGSWSAMEATYDRVQQLIFQDPG